MHAYPPRLHRGSLCLVFVTCVRASSAGPYAPCKVCKHCTHRYGATKESSGTVPRSNFHLYETMYGVEFVSGWGAFDCEDVAQLCCSDS
ncbi:hypothetical protein PR003_g3673 [Phytophthora rubi]|uniref:Secreted protein n=1 Tax=Phytophthora rubi TaxID=129364 RepID=A0A6A4G6A8_9STRA|nr:hypothetical protein PR002_g3642 [Phytophthora rubi]KAE9049218.1 hypothetical protein PR001_g3502 [Phytophthora rubi]KAE9353861.1 hypothetical protein PR003_g3673 [Phytophthora rubi]